MGGSTPMMADRALDMLSVDARGFDHLDRRLLLDHDREVRRRSRRRGQPGGGPLGGARHDRGCASSRTSSSRGSCCARPAVAWSRGSPMRTLTLPGLASLARDGWSAHAGQAPVVETAQRRRRVRCPSMTARASDPGRRPASARCVLLPSPLTRQRHDGIFPAPAGLHRGHGCRWHRLLRQLPQVHRAGAHGVHARSRDGAAARYSMRRPDVRRQRHVTVELSGAGEAWMTSSRQRPVLHGRGRCFPGDLRRRYVACREPCW
jgi:hypothetical protein